MVELVHSRKNGANGRTLEIMTLKARADIHINLPALKKLDSMLIETLDSMVDTEFGYVEGGSRAEGRNRTLGQSKRWWLPSPQVPATGLSDTEKNKLLKQGKVVHQVFKAARTINESVLLEMPVPTIIRDALPKSFEALNQHAVAVVVDPIQSVKRKVVIDAFRLINPQTMMLGQEPRQTTSNLGHLNRPSIQL
ncbi:hypothetical protein ABKV19_005251 [Rosa sericea]